MRRKRTDRAKVRAAIRARFLAKLPAVGAHMVDATRRRSPDETGRLDESYEHKVLPDEDRVIFGSRLPRSKYVEFGTVRMKPRAPIRRTLAEEADEALKILNTPER